MFAFLIAVWDIHRPSEPPLIEFVVQAHSEHHAIELAENALPAYGIPTKALRHLHITAEPYEE